MKIRVKNFSNLDCKSEDVKVDKDSVLAIDISTRSTGLCVMSMDKQPLYSVVAIREKGEEPMEYKVALKNYIKNILIQNGNIYRVVQEEPIPSSSQSAAVLYSMRTSVKEIIAEERQLRLIKYEERSNGAWKKAFLKLRGDKLPHPRNTEIEKQKVYRTAVIFFPEYEGLTLDETDALGLGYTYVMEMLGEIDSLANKEKIHPFKYDIDFVASDNEDVAMQSIVDLDTVPNRLKEGQIRSTALRKRDRVDNKVYNTIGNDDIIAMIKLSKDTSGNIILKHGISHLFNEYEHVYMVAWRKRKR